MWGMPRLDESSSYRAWTSVASGVAAQAPDGPADHALGLGGQPVEVSLGLRPAAAFDAPLLDVVPGQALLHFGLDRIGLRAQGAAREAHRRKARRRQAEKPPPVELPLVHRRSFQRVDEARMPFASPEAASASGRRHQYSPARRERQDSPACPKAPMRRVEGTTPRRAASVFVGRTLGFAEPGCPIARHLLDNRVSVLSHCGRV